MRKLVTVLCAAAAGAAMAQGVTSANIVGYQDFGGTGSFNFTVATFPPVGDDGSGMTLGDITANDTFSAGGDYANLYTGTGDFIQSITYSSPADAEQWGITPGWYEMDDYASAGENNLNATAMPYGAGFVFVKVTTGAALRYQGELKQSANTLPATGSFNFCGNTSPKDITLAEITGNDDFVAGTDYVNLFDATGTFLQAITYSSPADAAQYGITPGWYEMDDYAGAGENNLNATAVPAGAGFAFVKVTAAARLVVANPME